jgi:peptide deformylase
MIKPILLYTNKILNTPCKLVIDFEDVSLQELVSDLLGTLQANNGVGLAANQIGIDKQVCVLDVENRTKKMVLINPKIISYSKKKIKLNEGCLSVPGLSVEMKRPANVTVDANLLTGELIRIEFTGYDSRIFFHEFDHIQGLTLARTVQNYALLI